MKDGIEPMPMANVQRGPAGPCYVRGDLGYSVSRDPTVKWAVSNNTWTYAPPAYDPLIHGTYDPTTNVVTPPVGGFGGGFDPTAAANWTSASSYLGDSVTGTSMENAWFGGIGLGCGMGSYGIRAEAMLGYTGHRKISGEPLVYLGPNNPAIAPGLYDDPLHTGVRSYTAMINAYKDFGTFGRITPYIGAGVGVSYNMTSETYFTGNPFLTNRIEGDGRLSLAWSLMAGFGVQITDRAVLDFGYRYMDYGKAQSGRVDNAGFVNPRVYIDDLTAHEFKVGLRYHFGGSGCCAAPAYQPMK
jgi:opacity protein-like surface antigen